MQTPNMQNSPNVQENLYYRIVLSRRNLIMDTLLAFFMGICSYPRLVMEVFIRRNMGERYFTLMSAMTVGTILFFIPWLLPSSTFMPASTIIRENVIWYLFVVAFGFFSCLRYREVSRKPGTFDFSKYSKSDGDFLPVFARSKFTMRQIELYLEPLPVLLLGLLLLAVGQKLPGMLFTFCAIVYSISKAGEYWYGTKFILDKIDILLCNEDLKNDFLGKGKTQSEHGFKFRGPIPSDPEIRQNLYNSFFEADNAPLAY